MHAIGAALLLVGGIVLIVVAADLYRGAKRWRGR